MNLLPPQAQTEQMLRWFERIGVRSIDIHLRVPKMAKAAYDGPHWFWITEHEDEPIETASLHLDAWLRFMNARGADIYIRPHGRQAQPVLFLDDLEIAKAVRISQKYSACVIETSANNTQVWLATESALTPSQRAYAQRHLCGLGYTDPGSISGEHLGRMCGMKSQKRHCWVNHVSSTEGRRYHPSWNTASPSLPQGGPCASKTRTESLDLSSSAREFGWVLGRLRIGTPKEIVFRDLVRQAEARGKRASRGYATKTLENACKVLDTK